tara:strand:- start:2086 stop:2397 length:312 start_codon:yes stop_codon:yes gene_type:complete
MKIEYSKEFREKCFNHLRFFMDIRLLTSAIDNGHDSIVRYYLENALEDSELYIGEEIPDDGSRRIANAKIHAHNIRQELYNEYMELLTLTLDKTDVRRIELLR